MSHPLMHVDRQRRKVIDTFRSFRNICSNFQRQSDCELQEIQMTIFVQQDCNVSFWHKSYKNKLIDLTQSDAYVHFDPTEIHLIKLIKWMQLLRILMPVAIYSSSTNVG